MRGRVVASLWGKTNKENYHLSRPSASFALQHGGYVWYHENNWLQRAYSSVPRYDKGCRVFPFSSFSFHKAGGSLNEHIKSGEYLSHKKYRNFFAKTASINK